VLRAVGERLRLGLRAGDVAARVGGDEFALIVHVDSAMELTPVLDRIGKTSILGILDEADDVSWTIGVALCPGDAGSADELERVADSRLYSAKAQRERGTAG